VVSLLGVVLFHRWTSFLAPKAPGIPLPVATGRGKPWMRSTRGLNGILPVQHIAMILHGCLVLSQTVARAFPKGNELPYKPEKNQ